MKKVHENLSKYRLTSQEIFDTEKALDELLLFSKPLTADLYWGNMNQPQRNRGAVVAVNETAPPYIRRKL